MVTAKGRSEHVLSLVQQLAFLCASFGSVEGHAKVANYRRDPRPIAANLCFGPDSIGSGCDFAIDAANPKEFLNPADEDDIAGQKPCWHYIFRGLSLVHGFPIRPREEEKGVELPLDLMLGLSHVWYSIECHGTTVLNGYSTALVPVRKTERSLQWHLLHS